MRPNLQAMFHLKIRSWELVSAGGFLICLFSVAAFAGRYWWLLDLTSHFRFQYAVLLSLLAIIFLIASLRSRKNVGVVIQGSWLRRILHDQNAAFTTIFALFALLNWAVIVPHCWGFPPKSTVQGTKLRVMLMNVHRNNNDTELAIRRIKENDPDLIVLEEIDDHWWSALAGLQATFPYALRDIREDDFGIALLSKFPLQNGKILYFSDAEVPSVTAQLELGGSLVTVLGTHPVPPAGAEGTRLRDQQLAAVAEFIRPVSAPAIILGDLNTTPWNYAFRRLLKGSGLIDGSSGFGYQPTWPSFFWPMRIPLDHCLVSSDLSVLQHQVGGNAGSDHFPIIVDLAVK
jgi:endonuclease/exonuclease/phosphatase (EEP) superfamily protein YafD